MIFRAAITVIVWCLASAHAIAAPEIWFAPAGGSPDLIDMFKRPDQWSGARSEISVFKWQPAQVANRNRSGINTLADLAQAGAFRELRSWNIQTSIDAPAIKRWDCSGREAARLTLRYIENVRASGGDVAYLSLDEPLPAAVRNCRDSIESAAQKIAEYTRTIHERFPNIRIGVIQAYPGFMPAQIANYVSALVATGAKPAFLHLDINFPALAKRRQADLGRDIKAMYAMARAQSIPFGVILWSGHDPVPTDEAYYKYTMEWARAVRAAVIPDHVIIQSWVRRASVDCADGKSCAGGKRWHECGPNDPTYCAGWSVPKNLPDQEQFSHTRLLRDIVSLFR